MTPDDRYFHAGRLAGATIALTYIELPINRARCEYMIRDSKAALLSHITDDQQSLEIKFLDFTVVVTKNTVKLNGVEV